MSIEKIMTRLGDKVHPDVRQLISDITAQPLMVVPSMVDRYLRDALMVSKMASDVDVINGSYNSVPAYIYKEINTGVIDISGGLTARPVSVPCAKSPASYEGIKQAIGLMLVEDVKFIVARFNSGGGVASQMTVVSKWIKSQRPNVRLIACVDDHAYSAAYGLATAFDTIYVTETSGAGSIGVVLRTENNIKTEGDVEYIYAGDKKIDGAMEMELSDTARADYQQEVDRLYGLFTELVSDNLSISLEKVVETQAGTFHGEDIITAGLAHKLGTFEDVINNIYSGEEMNLQEIEAAEKRIAIHDKKLDDAKLEVANARAKLDADAEALAKEEQEAVLAKDNTNAEAQAQAQAEAQAEAQALKDSVKAEFIAKAESDAKIRSICSAANLSDRQADNFIAHSFSSEEVSILVADLTATSSTVNTSEAIKSEKATSDAIKSSWKKAFNR